MSQKLLRRLWYHSLPHKIANSSRHLNKMVARGPTTIDSTLLENFDMIRGSFVETESPKVQKSPHVNQTLARLRRKTAKKFFWHLRPYPHFFLLYSTSLKAKNLNPYCKKRKKSLFCVLRFGCRKYRYCSWFRLNHEFLRAQNLRGKSSGLDIRAANRITEYLVVGHGQCFHLKI